MIFNGRLNFVGNSSDRKTIRIGIAIKTAPPKRNIGVISIPAICPVNASSIVSCRKNDRTSLYK